LICVDSQTYCIRITLSNQHHKILFTGPECSGKSTSAAWFADHYNGLLVPEYARTYLSDRDSYDASDVINIAREQIALEERAVQINQLVSCDTSVLVLQIWMEVKFDRAIWSAEILKSHLKTFDVIFLCKPDFPWEGDGLREHEKDRDRLFNIYFRSLVDFDLPFEILKSDLSERQRKIKERMNEINYIH